MDELRAALLAEPVNMRRNIIRGTIEDFPDNLLVEVEPITLADDTAEILLGSCNVEAAEFMKSAGWIITPGFVDRFQDYVDSAFEGQSDDNNAITAALYQPVRVKQPGNHAASSLERFLSKDKNLRFRKWPVPLSRFGASSFPRLHCLSST